MIAENVTIFLTTQDAELFAKFRQFQDALTVIIRSGALETKAGEVTLRFDGDGTLREIEKRAVVYKRKAVLS